MSNFDAPNRESCTVRRERTNTPLQALQMMNDTQFIESARHLATNSLKSSSQDKERISKMFRKLTSRIPNETEMSIMIDVPINNAWSTRKTLKMPKLFFHMATVR